MATTRRPINRDHRRRITPRSVDLFRQLQATPLGDEWWRVHNALHDELGCKPHEWPCVESPDATRNYVPRPDALALWAQLEAAA